MNYFTLAFSFFSKYIQQVSNLRSCSSLSSGIFIRSYLDCDKNCQPCAHLLQDFRALGSLYETLLSIMAISHCSYCQCECHCQESANSSHAFPNHLQLTFADNNCQFFNPISTGLFYLVVALKGGGFNPHP